MLMLMFSTVVANLTPFVQTLDGVHNVATEVDANHLAQLEVVHWIVAVVV